MQGELPKAPPSLDIVQVALPTFMPIYDGIVISIDPSSGIS